MNETDLHDYQKHSVDFVINHNHCALFLDCGLGKTVSTLTAISYLMYEDFEIEKVLVIAPKKVAENTWSNEINKWDHLKHLTVSKVLGSEKARKEALKPVKSPDPHG